MTPAFVVPLVATTANSRSRASASRPSTVARSAVAVIRPSRSAGTTTTSASIARAAEAIDEWAPPDARSRPRVRSWTPPARSRHCQRAAINALRLPAVPPLTNTPPAPAGIPTRSAIQRSASFSANTAPPPSSHEPA